MIYSGSFVVLSIMLFTGTAVAAALAVVSSSTAAVSAAGGGGRQLIYGGWWSRRRRRPCAAAVVGWPTSADGGSVSSVPVRWLVGRRRWNQTSIYRVSNKCIYNCTTVEEFWFSFTCCSRSLTDSFWMWCLLYLFLLLFMYLMKCIFDIHKRRWKTYLYHILYFYLIITTKY